MTQVRTVRADLAKIKKMGKKILLPTDFSKNSWYAIQYAMKLYENQDCDFFILNTYATDAQGVKSNMILDPDRSFNKMAKNRSISSLGDILNRLSEVEHDFIHRFHVMSRPKPLSNAIKEAVKNLQIDMVVMGAKGMTNDPNGKYGKNTRAVIGNVRKCPIFVVPENISFARPKEIVFKTNFNTDFKISELKFLAEIAETSNASIQIVSLTHTGSLTPQQEQNKLLLKQYFAAVEHNFSELPYAGLADALRHLAGNKQGRIISYIDKRPSLWERIGFGRATLGKLGYYEHAPVLAFNG